MSTALTLCAMGIAFGFGGFIVFCAWLFALGICLSREMPRTKEKRVRWIIHILANSWVRLMKRLNILRIDVDELHKLKERHGLMFVANHPTYLDAFFFMSVFKNLFCLTKAGNLEKFWISGPARQAGYEDNRSHLRLVKNCVARLKRGENLLVFPEGTRTNGPIISEFKRGFSSTAIQALVPMVLVYIKSMNGPFLRKGQPFFSLCPKLPIWYQFRILGEIQPMEGVTSRSLARSVEEIFKNAAI
jgi:1-acyl-sn-glycerol-3-phosphate acyltransferase